MTEESENNEHTDEGVILDESLDSSPTEDAETKPQDDAQLDADDVVTETPKLTPEEKLQEELQEAQDRVLRTRADFDNYRKRMAREMERVRKTAGELMIHDILPGIDNLDLALQHADDQSSGLAEGVQMVYKQLQDALAGHGLKTIDALGELFDPNVHEAVSQAPSEEYDKGHITQVFQTGYTLGDVVLRPSKVVVSTGNGDSDSEDQDANTTETSASTE